jgi:hypothetical protein
MSRVTATVRARSTEGSTEVWAADDLAALRSLRFFFSEDRAQLRAPALPVAVATATEARLRALQSICGCSAAALGLFIGGTLAWWQGAPAWAVVGCAFGAAVVAKVGVVSAAYTAFLFQLSALRRALRGVEPVAGARSNDV